MFEEYQRVVLKKYRAMKMSIDCPSALKKPTPATLRDFCVSFLVNEYFVRDRRILKDFFGDFNSREELVSLIVGIDVDKFRPVINFMNGKTNNPNPVIVELLAWLIQLESRPYGSFRESEETLVEALPLTKVKDQEAISVGRTRKLMIRCKLKVRFVIVSVIVSIGIYFLINNVANEGMTFTSSSSENLPKNQCMYWNDTAFVSIACDEKLPNKVIIAADFDKISNFKKVTLPDTLTEKDVGKIWYSKIRNKVEFFTGPGVHPEQTDRHLKPLTRYMLAKYVVTGSM